jgi:hypothetical protein
MKRNQELPIFPGGKTIDQRGRNAGGYLSVSPRDCTAEHLPETHRLL